MTTLDTRTVQRPMSRADFDALADARVAREAPPSPRCPRPGARREEWDAYHEELERQALYLSGLDWCDAHPHVRPPPPRLFTADYEPKRLLAPVPREVRPLAPQDPRQLTLFRVEP